MEDGVTLQSTLWSEFYAAAPEKCINRLADTGGGSTVMLPPR